MTDGAPPPAALPPAPRAPSFMYQAPQSNGGQARLIGIGLAILTAVGGGGVITVGHSQDQDRAHATEIEDLKEDTLLLKADNDRHKEDLDELKDLMRESTRVTQGMVAELARLTAVVADLKDLHRRRR